MEKGIRNRCTLQEMQESLQEVLSIIIVLETDLSAECSDGVHYNVVKTIHRMLFGIQQAVDGLVQCTEKSTE